MASSLLPLSDTVHDEVGHGQGATGQEVLLIEIGVEWGSRPALEPGYVQEEQVADLEANRVWPESEAEIIAAHDVEQCALEQSEDDEEAPSAEAALAAIEADMRATTDLIEVTFISQLETSRTIELHCEGVHVHDLVCGVTFSTNASARQRWSARCGGATLHAWVVNPRVSTDFVLPAQTPLPEPRVVRERQPTARAAAAR